MKFLVAFALIAVACASPLARNKPGTNDLAEVEAVIAAIQSPHTDPATAALLEQQLADIIAAHSPISVEPAIIEPSPVSVGPAIIDFPLPDGGAVPGQDFNPVPSPAVQPTPVIQPSPVVVGEVPAGSSSPLVQIIVNVNGQESTPVAPVVVPSPVVEDVYVPGPVNVVDQVDIVDPAQVAEPIVVDPVQVAEPIVVDPVQVAEPIVVSPVIVGTPIIPTPAVNPIDTLN